MSLTRSTLQLSALLACAVLAACGVSAGGAIPCADDSSCPTDYPVCDTTAGKCVAGSSASTSTIQVVSVTRDDGASASAPITGTATVTVIARATAGVVKDSVAVKAGDKALALIAATPPTFTFKLDTALLFPAPGVNQTAVTLKASMRTGDHPTVDVLSADKVIQVDNQAPTLSAAALVAADVRPGASVVVDVAASEALSSITGTLATPGIIDGALTEVSVQNNVHRLSAPVLSSAAGGTYAITISARDLAGNQGTLTASPSFTVHPPTLLTASSLTLATAKNISLGGVLAATAGDVIGIAVALPSSFVLAPGVLPVVSVGAAGAAGTALAVSGAGSTFTASLPIAAQADGNYLVTLSATDIAGNVAPAVSSPFIVSKTPPGLSAITLATPVAGPRLEARFSFVVGQSGVTTSATVKGNAAACSGSTVISCTYAPTVADVAAGSIVPAVPVVATVKDALGNTSTATASLILDAQPPTLTLAVVGSLNRADGSLVQVDVTSSKPLASLAGTVDTGTGSPLAEIAPATGSTRHFGYAVTVADAEGPHTVTFTGADFAANVTVQALAPAFSIRHPFSVGLLALATGMTLDQVPGAVATATTGTQVRVSVTLPSRVTFSGSGQPAFALTTSAGTLRPLPVSTVTAGATSTVYSSVYTVVAGDSDGLAAVAVVATDVAGNTSSAASTVLIDKTVPLAGGLSLDKSNVDLVNNVVTLTAIASKRLQAATVVTTNGDTGTCTCDGGACNAATSAAPLISCAITVTGGATSGPIPVVATLAITDLFGNTSPATAPYQGRYTVVPAPAAASLTPGASPVPSGTSTTLTPVFANGTAIVIGSDGTRFDATSGASFNISPPGLPTVAVSTTYTLIVTNAAGTKDNSKQAVVTVVPAPSISSFTGPSFYVNGKAIGPLTAIFGPAGPNLATAVVTGTDGVSNYTCDPTPATTSPKDFICQTPVNGLDVVYTLTVTRGPASIVATLLVRVAPDPAKSIAFSVSGQAPVDPGGATTLTGFVCTGCTFLIGPASAISSFSLSGTTLTATTKALPVTTVFTLTVTNQVGGSAEASATAPVRQPVVTGFSGPAYYSNGKAPAPLVASFGPGPAGALGGASAAVTGQDGISLGYVCSPGNSLSSPQVFTCPPPANNVDVTYTMIVTLGNTSVSATTLVRVAADPTVARLTATTPVINPGSATAFTGTVCTGCSFDLQPAALVSGTPTVSGNTLTAASAALSTTTRFTLTVTNQAGTSSAVSALVTVRQPQALGFNGPSYYTNGTAPAALVAAFGPGDAGMTLAPAAAAVTGTDGINTYNCTSGSAVLSPQTFVCPAASNNLDLTYTLTVTLGTASTSATLKVKVASDPTSLTLNATTPTLNPGDSSALTGTVCTGCTFDLQPSVALASAPLLSGNALSATSTALAAPTRFTLTVTNQAGATASVSTLVTVRLPTIGSFSGPAFYSNTTAPGPLVAVFGPGATSSLAAASAVVVGTDGTASYTCVPGTSTSSPQVFTCPAASNNVDLTYTLTVTLGNASTSATLKVKVASDVAGTIAFAASAPSTVNPSGTVAFTGTVCAGCTYSIGPAASVASSSLSGTALSATSTALSASTTFTLTVTNQAGTSASAPATATVRQPVIAGFTGPAYYTNTTAPGPLVATFSPGASGALAPASASVSGSDGVTTYNCLPATSTTSPQTFTCPVASNNLDVTYVLSVSLGSTTITSSFKVKVAGDQTTTALTATTPTLNPGQSTGFTGTVCAGCTFTLTPAASISGTPSTAGTSLTASSGVLTGTTQFTLTVTNQAGASTSVSALVTVRAPSITGFTGPSFYTNMNAPGPLIATFGPGAVAGLNPASATVTGTDGISSYICNPAPSTTSPQTFNCAVATNNADVVYTLTVTLGTVTVRSTLTVRIASDPTTTTLSLGSPTINPGGLTTLSGTVCSGCTYILSPASVLNAPPSLSGTALSASTNQLPTTTSFTLTVTNQAGSTAIANAIATARTPVISSFVGPSTWTAGKTGLTLNASFGPGVAGALAGASAVLTATAGSTPTCSPAATTTSPQAFACGPITQDTTFQLTVTLGTGPFRLAVATLVVQVAPTRSVTAGTMANTRFSATATLLPGGKVLIAGGTPASGSAGALNTADLFDPASGTFTAAGQGAGCAVANRHMTDGRAFHTATLLPNGKVLLASGSTDGSNTGVVTSADLYDPAADCFAQTGSLQTGRLQAAAALLPNGNVLVAGGFGTSAALTSAELFTGATFATVSGGTQAGMTSARVAPTATALNNGLVLIAGGTFGPPVPGDLFDYTANGGGGQFAATAGGMQVSRLDHSATLLGSGKVLLAGGNSAGKASASAELYDPASRTFSATGSLNLARAFHTATLLPANTVLFAGGNLASGAPTATTEIYDAASGVFNLAAPMSVTRAQQVAAFLFNGQALIAGGAAVSGTPGELYTP